MAVAMLRKTPIEGGVMEGDVVAIEAVSGLEAVDIGVTFRKETHIPTMLPLPDRLRPK